MSYHSFHEICPDCEGAGGSRADCVTCEGNGQVENGSFEAFDVSKHDVSEACPEPGWYWWACSPGCLPDGDPSGPFATEEAAIDDANS